MRAKGSRFTLEVGVDLCSPDAAFMAATAGNRLQLSAMRMLWPCLWGVLQKQMLLEV